MLPAEKRRRNWSVHGGREVESSSVDVTPKRPHKKQRIRRNRKPDPCQSSNTSSWSSLSNTGIRSASAKRELKFSSVSESVGLNGRIQVLVICFKICVCTAAQNLE